MAKFCIQRPTVDVEILIRPLLFLAPLNSTPFCRHSNAKRPAADVVVVIVIVVIVDVVVVASSTPWNETKAVENAETPHKKTKD